MTDFAVIKPAPITAGMLTSNIDEPATGADPDPAVWAGATAYSTGERVMRAGTHRIYERINAAAPTVDATLPEVDAALAVPTKWVDVGATNRWRMFDQSPESVSSRNDSIVLTLQPGQLADCLVLMNVQAVSVRVQVADSDYDQTQELSTRVVDDWLSYFFGDFETKQDVIFTDLPLRSSNAVTVTITNTGGVASVGVCVLGRSKSIGGAQFGATAGITDYSTKDVDAFGNTEVVERAYSKRMNVTLVVPASKVDATQRLLAGYRATPVVYVGAGNLYGALIVYGFFRSFELVIAYPNHSLCNLEIEGLT